MTDYERSIYDVIPPMISSSQQGFIASASGTHQNYYAWHAFDGYISELTNLWVVYGHPAWLQIEMSQPWDVTSYFIASMAEGIGITYGNMPRNWTLLGSTDGINWTLLDTQVDQYWWYNVMREYPISSPGLFTHYRINITATDWTYYTAVAEFGLRGRNLFLTNPTGVISAGADCLSIIPSRLSNSTQAGIIAAILDAEGWADRVFPISSFNVRNESGETKYIQVIIPGLDYAEQIADRANGSLTLYRADGSQAIEIGRLPITSIRIDEGSKNKSITLQANA